ncbi:MAG: hypothetical protein OXI59_13445 [Gemmatimonadota bacterium]|nr:hypothetical protein [Gemmatimonadota bacterium]
MTKEKFLEDVDECLSQYVELDEENKLIFMKHVDSFLDERENTLINEERSKNELQILFEYERHYLELIKEYKEEIKFSASLQEDLRRERSQFFTQVLREVSETLKNASVDSNVASQWIQELVDSYTKSIDLSGDLAKTHVIDVIGKIKESAKAEVKSMTAENEEQMDAGREE